MEQLKELLGLAQRLDSILDDFSKEFIDITICKRRGVVCLTNPKFLLETFEDIKVTKVEGSFPFRLDTQLDGVHFMTYTNQEEIDSLNAYDKIKRQRANATR